MLLGAFQESGQIGDLWIMIVLGLFGWLLKETGFPRAPFLIGFVLAIPLERYYFLTDTSIRRRMDAAPLGAGLHRRARDSRHPRPRQANPRTPKDWRRRRARRAAPEDEHEGELAGSIWSLSAAAGMLAIFVAAFVVATSFSPEARLVPRLVCAGGAILTIVLLVTELRSWRKRSSPSVTWTPDVAVAMRTFIWMAAFLALVTLGGYLGALLIFVPLSCCSCPGRGRAP